MKWKHLKNNQKIVQTQIAQEQLNLGSRYCRGTLPLGHIKKTLHSPHKSQDWPQGRTLDKPGLTPHTVHIHKPYRRGRANVCLIYGFL